MLTVWQGHGFYCHIKSGEIRVCLWQVLQGKEDVTPGIALGSKAGLSARTKSGNGVSR